MRTSRLLLFVGLLAEALVALAPAQENVFELPVQLIGFPVIIMAVRLSNFVKKLAYSLNPRTYARRSRREALPDPTMDVIAVEKKLVGEFGIHVCVFEHVCAHYAEQTQNLHGNNHILDWNTVFGEYKSSASSSKQNYLLSVFLGDIVASPHLCHALAKRGRACREEQHNNEGLQVHHTVARKGNLTAPNRNHTVPLHTIPHRGNHTATNRRARPAHHGPQASHRENHSTHAAPRRRVLLDHPAQVPRRN